MRSRKPKVQIKREKTSLGCTYRIGAKRMLASQVKEKKADD
jgi:hypothetical protein